MFITLLRLAILVYGKLYGKTLSSSVWQYKKYFWLIHFDYRSILSPPPLTPLPPPPSFLPPSPTTWVSERKLPVTAWQQSSKLVCLSKWFSDIEQRPECFRKYSWELLNSVEYPNYCITEGGQKLCKEKKTNGEIDEKKGGRGKMKKVKIKEKKLAKMKTKKWKQRWEEN
jgi:hypothetical protein